MVQNPKQGTGDKLGSIDLSNGESIEFWDDGDPGNCNKWSASWGASGDHNTTTAEFIRKMREEFGDQVVIDMFDDMSAPSNDYNEHTPNESSDTGPSSTDYIGRSSFKCDDCGKTFPYNKTYCPDPGRDVCDGCSS